MRRLLLTTLALLWSSVVALANVSCSLPFNLQNNTTADATQVMANYNALVTCLTNAAAAGSNSDITALLGLLTPLTQSAGGTPLYTATGSSTGSANAQTVASPSPTGFTLTQGKSILFKAGFTNTGATTLNINGQGATAVLRLGHAGPEALTGGEIVSGNTVLAVYDGTQFILISSPFADFGTQATVASAGTTDLGAGAPNHNALVTGSVTITSFGSTAVTTEPIYLIKFSGAPLLTYNASSLILPGAANLQAAANDTAMAMYLGSGNWQIISYTKANGTSPVTPTPLPGFNHLVIKNNAGTPATQIDYTADSAVLVNPSTGASVYRTSLSGTVNLTNGTVTSTCLGMDGETRPAANWVYLWVFDNGTAPCMVGSTSVSAPTAPAGYTYQAYAGAMRTVGSSLLSTQQRGNVGQYITPANVQSGSAIGTWSQTAPTWSAQTMVPNFAPTNATGMCFNTTTVYNNLGTGANIAIAPNTGYGGVGSTNPPPISVQAATGDISQSVGMCLRLEATTVAIASQANGGISVLNWTDAVNAN